MDIIDWTRLDEEPVDTRTADEFRQQHAEEARLTLEEFDRYLVVVREGDHWISLPRTLWKREQREARKREIEATREYVYCARLGDLVKIGFSRDPQARARSLNADLLGVFDGGRKLEAELHREFADLRVRGEWFQADDRLLAWIEGAKRA